MSPLITALGPSNTGDEVGAGQWVLSDANGANEFIFNIGPSSGGALQEQKAVAFQNELGADSVTVSVVDESGAPLPTISITGTVLNTTQLGYLEFFARRSVPLLLQDDLDREIQVYPEHFEAHRKHSFSHPEIHEYTFNFMVLDDKLDGEFWADYV